MFIKKDNNTKMCDLRGSLVANVVVMMWTDDA